MPRDRAEATADLRELLAEFQRSYESSDDALIEEEALRIANEEVNAFRRERDHAR